MIRITSLLALFLMAQAIQTFAFCGFYVAKADASLFNKASQVIIARDGQQTVVTMSSDFEGPVKDFAMVVPVPEVLTRDRIRLADRSIFDKLDTYSGPRLVEYHDSNPCYVPERQMLMESMATMSEKSSVPMPEEEIDDDYGVTVLETYSVGEYDILILSAEESDGLETWLTKNGYKIPKKAADILEPYIKSNLKFFVVKVNLEALEAQDTEDLRPIQMTFRSERFGLPIRLGMANANGPQDMIVYAFSQKGRIETANYRTVEIPSNENIPLFVQPQFGEFYSSLYDKAWKKNDRKAVMLEYAWDLSSHNYVKCDPCATTPPTYAELREAGIFWVGKNNGGGWGNADYQGDVFITRLHVRYSRETFPQDLQFQITPNRTNFQGRYILTHPASGTFECKEGQAYLKTLRTRRQKEVTNLLALTEWDKSRVPARYINEYDRYLNEDDPWIDRLEQEDPDRGMYVPVLNPKGPLGPMPLILMFAALLATGGGVFFYLKKRQRMAMMS